MVDWAGLGFGSGAVARDGINGLAGFVLAGFVLELVQKACFAA